jgi:hypothetical protein
MMIEGGREWFLQPEKWPTTLFDLAAYLVLLAAAIFRRLDSRLRAAILLLPTYALSVSELAEGGLAGSGRLFMFAVTVGAILLIGTRAGVIATTANLLTLASFTTLVGLGALQAPLVGSAEAWNLDSWIGGSIDAGILLVLVAVLLSWSQQFQAGVIGSERRASADLVRASSDQQRTNVALQQKVAELTTVREVGDALSATLDLEELLERSLRAVCSHLNLDRATILLVNEERRVLEEGCPSAAPPRWWPS